VDRLLGGRSGPRFDDPVEQRPLTEIDHRLAARLIEAARQCVLEIATAEPPCEINDLPPQTTSFEEAWLPDCSLLRLSFELRFVQGGGSLDLLIPLEAAADFASCDADLPLRSMRQDELPSDAVRGKSSSRTAVIAHIARMTLSAEDLRSLAVGDVLVTEVGPDEPLEVLVDGTSRFHAESGRLSGQKAIRLLGPVSES
jgi:flagellar motor switch protein FliM